jgi:hypothetical protein
MQFAHRPPRIIRRSTEGLNECMPASLYHPALALSCSTCVRRQMYSMHNRSYLRRPPLILGHHTHSIYRAQECATTMYTPLSMDSIRFHQPHLITPSFSSKRTALPHIGPESSVAPHYGKRRQVFQSVSTTAMGRGAALGGSITQAEIRI